MGRLFTIALKDLRLITRDPLGLFFIIGFPVVMGVFFGLIGGSFDTDEASITIAVIDRDQSDISARFVEALTETGSVEFIDLDLESAADQVRRGRLVGYIEIPEGFGDTAGVMWLDPPELRVGLDPSRSAESGMVQGFIMQAMGALVMERFTDTAMLRETIDQSRAEIAADPELPAGVRFALNGLMGSLDTLFGSLDDLNETMDDATIAEQGPSFELATITPVDVTADRVPSETEQLVSRLRSKWDISFPAAILWGVLGCAAGFAVTMVRERTKGTYTRLQVAPIPRWQILAGKGLACFLAVIAVNLALVALGMALGMRPRDFVLLGVAIVFVAWCFVGVMMLMSVIGKSEEAVGGAAWGANVIMAMFGGGMVPLAFMPGFMKAISNFSPVKWGVLALEGAIWRGFTLAEMALPLGVLFGIGLAGLLAGSLILTRARA
ncbi:MAG: ABC transporter permease [Phycisphaerales bacterium]